MAVNDSEAKLHHEKQFYEAQNYATSMEDKRINSMHPSPEPT